MKLNHLIYIILLSSICLYSQAYELNDFILGKYSLIGKKLNSNETYQGTIEITKTKNGLLIKKKIGDQIIKGTASIEDVLAGESKVLRIQVKNGGKQIQETCLIQSDLDNFARITCYLYQPDKQTSNPGLEAFFYQK